MNKKELRKIIGNENYDKLNQEDIELILNTAGKINFGVKHKMKKSQKYSKDKEIFYADVIIWFYNKYNPVEYKHVFPYHESKFYCIEDPKNNVTVKFANKTIYQIKEIWNQQ